MSGSVSSYIPTGNASGTRNREQPVFPFTAVPQALTVYLKVRLGAAEQATGGNRVFWQLGSTGASPRLTVEKSATQFTFGWFNSTGGGHAAWVTTTPIAGSLVEIRGTLSPTGVMQLGLTVNGSSESVSAASTPRPFPTVWASQKTVLNGTGATGNVNLGAYVAACVVRGVQSLDTMRRFAGTHTRNG